MQDVADVVERWGGSLPPAQVHVVTVPPAGADPGILWDRFASLLGLDPASFDTRASRANTSLGVEQTELLRRVNEALGDRVPLPGPYPRVAKDLLAHRILAARPGGRLVLDRATTELALERSQEIVERLGALEVDVVGDLDELLPEPLAARAAASDTFSTPSDEVLLAESVAALAGLLDALANRGAQRRYEEMIADLKRAPVRFALRRASERRPALRKARSLYRRRTWLTERLGAPSRRR